MEITVVFLFALLQGESIITALGGSDEQLLAWRNKRNIAWNWEMIQLANDISPNQPATTAVSNNINIASNPTEEHGVLPPKSNVENGQDVNLPRPASFSSTQSRKQPHIRTWIMMRNRHTQPGADAEAQKMRWPGQKSEAAERQRQVQYYDSQIDDFNRGLRSLIG